MTEKEKQIIEMAGDMSFASTKVDLYLDDRKEIAKVLYLLSYRKVPEGAVVLTKEEWEALLAQQKQLEEKYSYMRNYVIDCKTKTETLTQYHIQLEQDLAEARQETAKAIYIAGKYYYAKHSPTERQLSDFLAHIKDTYDVEVDNGTE